MLRNTSLKRKLTLVSFATSATALLLVGLVFSGYAIHSDRVSLSRQLATQADIIGFAVTPALLFDDELAAREQLAALRAESQVNAAAIYRADGSLLASFVRAGAAFDASAAPHKSDAEELDFSGGSFKLTRAISAHGRPIGSIYLQAGLAALEARLRRYGLFTFSVLSVSLLVALGIGSQLQREISRPVLELVQTARTVADQKDYRIRAAVRGRDELGVLVDAFNDMLAEIEGRDVQLRKVNHQLHQRTDELGRKHEEVESFVYIVSHDLRAPLVNLQGFSRELKMSCESLAKQLEGAPLPAATAAQVRELTDEEIPTSLRFISASTAKFERLINALLHLSRSGRRELAPEPLDMEAIVASTIDTLMGTVGQSGAQISVGPLPPAFGDRTAVEQVISNLLINALRYLQPGRPGLIAIGGERRGAMVEYWIEDNGVGISAVGQKKLFQVFQRLRPDLAEGEGIGLATVKRVIERHSGKVWIHSAEGEGTKFSFSLPAEMPAEGDIK